MQMVSDIAIGTITFHPSPSVLQRLIRTLADGYKIYLFDNSPEDDSIRNFIKTHDEYSDRFVYLTAGRNCGLGFGLASICAQAYYDSFKVLLFFDQDTGFSLETLKYVERFHHENVEKEKSYSAIVFNALQLDAGQTDEWHVQDVRLAINSGSLFILENCRKFNWHNPRYFVDCVDYEFCLSSSNAGFKIGEVSTTPGFDHTTEQGDEPVRLFGHVYPMRAYRMSRIWDSFSASIRLMGTSLRTGNLTYFGVIGSALVKYLFVQTYIRLLRAFRSLTSNRNN